MAPTMKKRKLNGLVPVSINVAIRMVMSDIHLLRMLARASSAREVPVIMKGYGYRISKPVATQLSALLNLPMTLTIRQLVEIFNGLEIPKSIPPGIQDHFRIPEWTGPTGRRGKTIVVP